MDLDRAIFQVRRLLPDQCSRAGRPFRNESEMIEHVRTGEQVETIILPATLEELRSLEQGWRLSWVDANLVSTVYKLVAPSFADRILGLIAIRRIQQQYVEVKLLESNPRDVGSGKENRGIAGSLLAFAAEDSIFIGGEGCLTIDAKTALMPHYEKAYGFRRLGHSQRMLLEPMDAAKLIRSFSGEPTDA